MLKHNRINIRSSEGNGILIVLSIFTATFYIYRDLGLSTLIGWFGVLGYVIFNIALRQRTKLFPKNSVEKKCFMVISFCICVFLLRPDSRHDIDEMLYTIAMLICLLVVIYAEPSYGEIKVFKSIFETFSIGIAGYIIFFKIFPNIYWDTIYRIIADSSKQLAAYYMPRGYGIPIGGSYTIGYYIMMVAAVLIFNKVTIYKYKKSDILKILFILIAMVAEGRRGEIIALVLAMVVLLLLSKDVSDFGGKACLLVGLLIVFTSSFNLILDILKKSNFFYRYALSLEGILAGDDITSGRIELWLTAINLFIKHPFLGIGFGGYAYNVTSSFKAIHGQDVMDVHNCFLQFLCEIGIIGTVIIVTPMIIVFMRNYRTIKTLQRNNSDELRLIAQTSLGIQVFFLMIGMLDPSFYKPVFWCFYGLAFILSEFTQRKIKEQVIYECSQ